jgi:hypothetical protein
MEQQDHLSASATARRYGVSVRTISRWVDKDAEFPRPLIINWRRYFKITDLEVWERARAAMSGRQGPSPWQRQHAAA